jgi:hypothetical protein
MHAMCSALVLMAICRRVARRKSFYEPSGRSLLGIATSVRSSRSTSQRALSETMT